MLIKFIAGIMAAGIALSGGYIPKEEILPPEVVVTIEPDVEDLSEITDEEMKITETVVRNRLDAVGLVEVEVERDGKQIKVKAWDSEIEDEIIEAVLKKTGGLQFLDVDGNVLMEGTSEYISSAKWTCGYTGPISSHSPEHYVSIYFTPAGREKFKEITEIAVEKISTGENIIAIAVDGVVYSSPLVTEVIDSDSCIVTGEFDEKSAKELANVINSGLLDFDLKIVK